MYSFFSQLSQWMSEPVSLFLSSYEHSPLVIALLLGLVGAVAPCQLTGNVSAITLYGNSAIQMHSNGRAIASFMAGKVVVYSAIGLLAWFFGQSFEEEMTKYFPIFRKAIGPLLVITGLVLVDILKLKFINHVASRVPVTVRKGRFGSFLLGASFAVAFCPTMFVLFFVWLMPTVVATSYGLVLPAVFGIATSIPLLIVLGLIWYFDVKGVVMRKSMKVGRWIQRIAGALLIVIGVLDTLTYWVS